MDFVVLANHKVNEKRDKYLDLARDQRKNTEGEW